MILISKEIENIIKAEGEKAYPNECCGVIFGIFGEHDGKKIAVSTEPIINSSGDDEKHHRFLITPEDMLKAELTARAKKLDIIGFYHSHPDHPSEPSEYDKENALPFYSYIIVSVINGITRDFTSWDLSENRERFYLERIHKM